MNSPPQPDIAGRNHLSPQPFYTHHSQSQPVLPPRPNTLRKKKSAWGSMQDVAKTKPAKHEQGMQSSIDIGARLTGRDVNECPVARSMNQAAAYCDVVATRLNEVLARIDAGEEQHAPDPYADEGLEELTRGLRIAEEDGEPKSSAPPLPKRPKHGKLPSKEQTRSKAHLLNFHKSWLYANSRLPPHMMPFKVYMPTWQILCKAADASQAAYQRPRRGEREDFVEANWRQGTKAMVLKSTPLDDQNLIIIAIRGSQWNVIDWAVNFTIAPTEPTGFLDDQGNACHEGFLQVARSMIVPVAARLRQLLEQDPSRAASSLLITGHSAGGAVASLLFMHMLSRTLESELTLLAGCFKRVHCVTFGVPPVSLLPLQKPKDRRYEKNVFLSFVNEGDLVVRADREYMKSLIKLLASPAPAAQVSAGTGNGHRGLREKVSMHRLKADNGPQPVKKYGGAPPVWPVPEATLSTAGRMVLLREKRGRQDKVEAVGVNDQQLRGVMFGEPEMHHMATYQTRIERLAFAAVTGREEG